MAPQKMRWTDPSWDSSPTTGKLLNLSSPQFLILKVVTIRTFTSQCCDEDKSVKPCKSLKTAINPRSTPAATILTLACFPSLPLPEVAAVESWVLRRKGGLLGGSLDRWGVDHPAGIFSTGFLRLDFLLKEEAWVKWGKGW